MQRASVFSPTNIAESKLWFSNIQGVTNVSGKASSWTDVISGLVVANATDSERPIIGTGLNGRASLGFTSAAATKLVNTTANPVTAGAARYVLFVAKVINPGGTLFSFRINITGGRQWIIQCVDGGGVLYCFTDSVSENVFDGGYPVLTSTFVYEIELTAGATPVLRINSVNKGLGGSLHADPEAGTTGFVVGARGAANGNFNGDIGDIYCASPIPSAGDKTKLVNYFKSVYGLTY